MCINDILMNFWWNKDFFKISKKVGEIVKYKDANYVLINQESLLL